jgi:hypothetical protein
LGRKTSGKWESSCRSGVHGIARKVAVQTLIRATLPASLLGPSRRSKKTFADGCTTLVF